MTSIKEKIEKNKLELLLNAGLFLLIFVSIGFAPVFYNWYSKDENGIWLKRLYEVLNGCPWINIPICIVILCVFFRWICKIVEDRDIRLYRPILAVLGIVILFSDKSQVTYAKIFLDLDYRCFLSALFVFIFVIAVARYLLIVWRKYCSKKDLQTKTTVCQAKGFSNDNNSEVDISESLKNYAKEIVDRLLKTDITVQSFALGVTGEWGVGKTRFLDELEENIKEHANIVKFNPWMCSSPEQVTNDFFASLRHQLSPIYSRLSNPIKEYSRYIGSLAISSHPWASLDFLLSTKQESLFEKKKTLSQKFSKLPNPVVVIIDDIDRLERDEVFEVLRLIRNTADLSNVIYIVAYDKEYVTCVLEEKNIKDSSAYLEKIFSIEVHLPKVEEHLIWEVLYDEIDAQNSLDKDFTKKLFSHFDSDDKELILRILDNYRRTKRFARLYMLYIAYLGEMTKGELKALDIFWLELLQVYDKKSYDVLAYDANVLLYQYEDRFWIKKGILFPVNKEEVYNDTFNSEPFWKEKTPKILEKLFGKHVKKIRQSICYTENYDKYFTLSVSPFKLSIREMNELFEAKDPPYIRVKKWIDSGKYLNSIAYQFKHISACQLDDNKLKTYIHGLLSFAMLISSYKYILIWQEVKKMLWNELYTNGIEIEKITHDIVLNWFKEKISKNDSKELLVLGRLLHRLYATICSDVYGREEPFHELVISNNEIESLLVNVMKTYLIANSEFTALDVLTGKGDLAYMFESCCVIVRDDMASNNSYEYKQLAYDVIIEHFASKEDKPTFEEFDKAFGNIFKREEPVFDNPDEENEYYAHMEETYENHMQMYFGSSYYKYYREEDDKLKKFKSRCFVKEKIDGKNAEDTIIPVEIHEQNTKANHHTKKNGKGKKKKC